PHLVSRGRPAPGASLRRLEGLGAQGHPQCRRLGAVLERSDDRRVRGRHLARRTLPSPVMEPAVGPDREDRRVISPLAGPPAPSSLLLDVARLEHEYYERTPEMDDATQLVAFGTSGHRGSPLRGSFTEAYVAAITQAICEYRRQGIDGPLYMGKDTHALSEP